MDEIPLPISQASSHLALEPVVASAVLSSERERRVSSQKLGACRTGCDDIDDYVLLGGLERGSVVGLSSEREDEFGLVLAVQILAHSLSQGVIKRVLVITPKPATTILPVLRDGITAELAAREPEWKKTSPTHRAAKVRDALDKVMLSCVFDMDGLWEVLADLERPDPTPVQKVEEIQDSEDEEDDDLGEETGAAASSTTPATEKTAPDMIVITHFSSLLSALFSHRSSAAAHAKLQLLASHVRRLSRSLPSNPLILILNSTNTAVDTSSTTTPTQGPTAPPPPPTASYPSERQRKQLDPTLRSIFHNPQPSANYGEGMAAAAAAARRYTVAKPAFGLVFAQLLDLHLLCTRVPRSRKDSELLAGVRTPAAAATPRDRETVEFVTVVEVLLDEMGVWKGTTTDGGGDDDDDTRKWARKNREQRWGPVVIDGGRVVEAFAGAASTKTTNLEPVRVHGGFGGPRV
ncbi:unnamed protein product [Clonostachys rhizophaga]|uniref:Uncharacterized protein n=1 Tax=Clonostachys rhizophaga TaxID=160324 RepID=A0A9N9V650_9HYPO|nr:unnamed protein product [Clonostachys rhizophaga]